MHKTGSESNSVFQFFLFYCVHYCYLCSNCIILTSKFIDKFFDFEQDQLGHNFLIRTATDSDNNNTNSAVFHKNFA